MKVTIKRITNWSIVLDSARTTVGKEDLNKEPSDEFKKEILIAEHSPIRNLQFQITWEDIPYWVAMHLSRHHIGLVHDSNDIMFVETQRTDRTQINRNKLTQDALVIFKITINAQSIINISRVRLCNLAAKETKDAWLAMLVELDQIEPELTKLCVPNCIYRSFCPEIKSCGYIKNNKLLTIYHNYIKS